MNEVHDSHIDASFSFGCLELDDQDGAVQPLPAFEVSDQLLCAHQCQHSSDVVDEGHQRHFTGDLCEPSKEECPVVPDTLEGTEDMFHDLLPTLEHCWVRQKTLFQSVKDCFVFPSVDVPPAWRRRALGANRALGAGSPCGSIDPNASPVGFLGCVVVLERLSLWTPVAIGCFVVGELIVVVVRCRDVLLLRRMLRIGYFWLRHGHIGCNLTVFTALQVNGIIVTSISADGEMLNSESLLGSRSQRGEVVVVGSIVCQFIIDNERVLAVDSDMHPVGRFNAMPVFDQPTIRIR